MKKLFLAIVFVCLFSLNSSAISPAILGIIEGETGGASCASCTGTTLFIWECNSTTVGDTGYSPCGCSAGSTTMSAGGGNETISGGAAVFDDDSGANGNDYYYTSITTEDIVAEDEGTIFVRFKIDSSKCDGTDENGTIIWKVDADSVNYFRVYISGCPSPYNLVLYRRQNDTYYDNITLSGDALVAGTEYIMRYRWDASASSADHELDVFNTSMSEQDGSTAGGDLNAMSASLSALIVGNNSSTGTDSIFYVYYIHIYSDWRDTDIYGP